MGFESISFHNREEEEKEISQEGLELEESEVEEDSEPFERIDDIDAEIEKKKQSIERITEEIEKKMDEIEESDLSGVSQREKEEIVDRSVLWFGDTGVEMDVLNLVLSRSASLLVMADFFIRAIESRSPIEATTSIAIGAAFATSIEVGYRTINWLEDELERGSLYEWKIRYEEILDKLSQYEYRRG